MCFAFSKSDYPPFISVCLKQCCPISLFVTVQYTVTSFHKFIRFCPVCKPISNRIIILKHQTKNPYNKKNLTHFAVSGSHFLPIRQVPVFRRILYGRFAHHQLGIHFYSLYFLRLIFPAFNSFKKNLRSFNSRMFFLNMNGRK